MDDSGVPDGSRTTTESGSAVNGKSWRRLNSVAMPAPDGPSVRTNFRKPSDPRPCTFRRCPS